jgi:NAD(P)-dependent dehydrogenase (short-subunit alcohol dehydrogenase family)
MPHRVANKVALVTGAAQGIGRGCAELLAREGAAVVVADIREEQARNVVDAINKRGGNAAYFPTDVCDEDQCARVVNLTIEKFKRLDILINNAGWFPRATLEETTTELWEGVIRTNLRGPFYCCKYAVPHMRTVGGGSIINIGSINGIQGLSNLVAYSAAKGGLLALTRTLAGALAEDRIRVNYVIPGWVLTEGETALHLASGKTLEQLRRSGQTLPLGRHQTVEDVAYVVVYLASDESTQITASVINVDAGASMLPLQPRPTY